MRSNANAMFHKAKNVVKRLNLDCRIERVQETWRAQLVKVFGIGTVTGIKRLAAELQADVLTELPEMPSEQELFDFELAVLGDDTVFDEEK